MIAAMDLPRALAGALDLRRNVIEPVARAQRLELAPEPVLACPPMVLLLGNHSSGKSSLINHLLGRDVQRTGVAPIDDGFTVLFHADHQKPVDGPALTSNPDLPFQELASFGPGLVQHLAGRGLDCDLLRHVWLIDSPGMIDAAGGDARRPYDFTGVVRWFAERCDLVLLLFDPEKPGTTGETLQVLTESLAGIDQKLRIVMNKMDLFDSIRDFARTYGALCWNLSRCLPTKDMPHIHTTVVPGLARSGGSLPLGDFTQALLEIEQAIAELPDRRADAVVTRVLGEARRLRIRTRIIEYLRSTVRAARFRAALLPAAFGVVLAWFSWLQWHLLGSDAWRSVVLTIIATACAFLLACMLPAMVARRSERKGRSDLDELFRTVFHDELARRERAGDLAADWEATRGGLMRVLDEIGLAGIGRVERRRLRALDHAVDHGLPELRRL